MSRVPSVGSRMAHGVGWMLLFKIVDRGVGFISVIVLARLLVPADFGLVALAMSAIALLDALSAFGLETALLQRSETRREHYDAVWTFQMLFGLVTGATVVATAPWVAEFYRDDRLVAVMFVMAAVRVVGGFENVGIVAFRREMEFDREFRFLAAKRMATSWLVTLPLAFLLRDYWALLIGTLAGTMIAVALSYALHPFRPRLALKGIGELIHFSKWLYLTSLIEFARSGISDIIVGRWTDAAAVGSLKMARELARFPTQELSAPINRAVFPGYVKLTQDRAQLQKAYLKIISAVLLVVMPAGIGLCLLAEPITLAMLGDRWRAAIPLIQILSVGGILGVMTGTAYNVNLAVGHARSTSLILAGQVAVALPLMLWSVPQYGALGAVVSTVAASAVTAPFNFALLGRAIEFGRRELVRILWRPLAGTLAMTGVVVVIGLHWAVPSTWSGQVAYVLFVAAAGAAVYAAFVYVLWRPRSDPESAEAWMLGQLGRALAAAVRRLRALRRGGPTR